jgi:hypothetical protein
MAGSQSSSRRLQALSSSQERCDRPLERFRTLRSRVRRHRHGRLSSRRSSLPSDLGSVGHGSLSRLLHTFSKSARSSLAHFALGLICLPFALSFLASPYLRAIIHESPHLHARLSTNQLQHTCHTLYPASSLLSTTSARIFCSSSRSSASYPTSAPIDLLPYPKLSFTYVCCPLRHRN